MSNEAQLAKWRVKFESRYDQSQLSMYGTAPPQYKNTDVQEAWGNYVEAREDASQENEQAKAIAVSKINIEIIREAAKQTQKPPTP